MFNGTGVITYKDNSKYVSFFKDNKFHGKGTKYNVDGTTIDYEYDNGISFLHLGKCHC